MCLLKDHANFWLLLMGKIYLPGRWLDQPGKDAQERGFTRTGRSKKADKVARAHFK